jgi:hypothetical protein
MSGPVVVLVEGESDRVALEALATRRGLDLAAGGIVAADGGIGNLSRFLEGTVGPRRRLRSYDAVEERACPTRAGDRLGRDLLAKDEALGFFA